MPRLDDFLYDRLLIQTNGFLSTYCGLATTPGMVTNILDDYVDRPNAMSPAGIITLDSIFKELCSSISTSNMRNGVINFYDPIKQAQLSRILHGYNVHTVATTMTEADIYHEFDMAFGLTGRAHVTTWHLYAKGIYEGANFINSFPTEIDLFRYIRLYPATHHGSIWQKHTGITLMGPVIADNFLKEIGLVHLCKVDTHIVDFLLAIAPQVAMTTGIHLVPGSPTFEADCQSAMSFLAHSYGITVYKLDKMIWLCCSGHYYRHSNRKYMGGAAHLKPIFLHDITAQIAGGALFL